MIDTRLGNLKQERASNYFDHKVHLDEKLMNRSATFERLKKDRMKFNKYMQEQHSVQSEMASDLKSQMIKTGNDSRYRHWAQAG
jgi:hypothetical protein